MHDIVKYIYKQYLGVKAEDLKHKMNNEYSMVWRVDVVDGRLGISNAFASLRAIKE